MTIPIPDAALNQHIAVLGKTGSGKSSVMRLLAEHLLNEKKPVCIIDPKGDWYGLRSSADGKSAGYSLRIFGGEHADIPINAHAGAAVAELVATGNRPCIIDLGGWMVGERTRFFIEFAQALFRLTRGHRWIIIDEVHNFAPQGKVLDVDAGKMLHWANRLASEGRGKGLTLLSASQRPQKVHKDFLTCAETLIAMRVIHPLDRGAVKEWIDSCADPTTGKDVINSLAQMERGEGWVWSPEIGFGPKRVKFPKFKTYDSFQPQSGEAVKLKGWAEVDLDEEKKKFAAVIEQARANDPGELKKQIAQLKAELAKKPSAALAPEIKIERVEVPVITDKDRELIVSAREAINDFQKQFASMDERLGLFWAQVNKMRPPNYIENTHKTRSPGLIRQVKPEMGPELSSTPDVEKKFHPLSQRVKVKPMHKGNGADLPRGEKLMLAAIAQYPEGADRVQLTILTGFKRSTRDTYIQRLRERGFVNTVGQIIHATEEGISALGTDYEPLPTGEALQAHWLAKLPEGERLILEMALDAYPKTVTRDLISEETGYARSSRDTYIQRLGAKKLIATVGRGEIKAAEVFFE
jgi:energy-coupling factor transporter ATP-binding protein EcfA2